MNKLYLLIWFLLIICSAPVVFAQEAGALTGVVQDERGTAVGFATVSLLQATDAKVVAGEIADAAGRFRLKTPAPGRYSLRISLIGFTPTDMPPFEVNTVSFSKDFGIINLKQDAKALQEVTVQSMRPTITQKADRMVVSVAGTAMAAGSNAYTVLAKSPGVFIDQDGNLQLNGRSGVMVMLDGKQTYLSARDLRNLLEGMSAENLKDIEIITNPSAKYDAEGTSGIININLKRMTSRV